MHAAARSGALSVARFLVSAGAVPGVQNAGGVSPLHTAAQLGHAAVVRLMLEKNADANIATRTGVTSLLVAAEGGHTGVMQQLLDAGANINHRDAEGTTPVLAAAHFGRIDAVQLLLANRGQRVDAKLRSNAGLQALFSAAQSGHTEVVRLLVAAGAPMDSTFLSSGPQGTSPWTAAEAAMVNGHDDLAHDLESGVWMVPGENLLAELKSMSGELDGSNPTYRVTKKAAVRSGMDLSTEKIGDLEAGMVIVALESRQVILSKSSGTDALRTRIRFEHDTVSGWTSVQARDGATLLKLLGADSSRRGSNNGGRGGSFSKGRGDGRLRVSHGTFSNMGISDDGGIGSGARRAAVVSTSDNYGVGGFTAGNTGRIYRVVSKAAIRAGADPSSSKRGHLDVGTLIQSIETHRVNRGKKAGVLRVCFEGGWVSATSSNGSPKLEPVGEAGRSGSLDMASSPWETPLGQRDSNASSGRPDSGNWRLGSNGAYGQRVGSVDSGWTGSGATNVVASGGSIVFGSHQNSHRGSGSRAGSSGTLEQRPGSTSSTTSSTTTGSGELPRWRPAAVANAGQRRPTRVRSQDGPQPAIGSRLVSQRVPSDHQWQAAATAVRAQQASPGVQNATAAWQARMAAKNADEINGGRAARLGGVVSTSGSPQTAQHQQRPIRHIQTRPVMGSAGAGIGGSRGEVPPPPTSSPPPAGRMAAAAAPVSAVAAWEARVAARKKNGR